jgi:cytoskeletal protein RodZ
MASVGEKLRTARFDQGLDLADLSARTKISAKFLAAIEADDRQSIPGGFFYRSWVAQYARVLSLDAAAMTAEIDRILIQEQAPPLPGQVSGSLNDIKPARITIERRSSGNRLTYSFVLLVAVMLGCSGLYAWWHRSVQTQEARVQKSDYRAASAAAKRPVPSVEMAQPVADPTPTDTPIENAAVAKAETTAVANASEGDVQIELSATEETWVSVSGDGKQAFSGILQPAEIKTVAARDEARIRVGNAGGLQVRLNGKSIGPIGTAGQVRTVIINKTGFQILEPKPTPPAPALQSEG